MRTLSKETVAFCICGVLKLYITFNIGNPDFITQFETEFVSYDLKICKQCLVKHLTFIVISARNLCYDPTTYNYVNLIPIQLCPVIPKTLAHTLLNIFPYGFPHR